MVVVVGYEGEVRSCEGGGGGLATRAESGRGGVFLYV